MASITAAAREVKCQGASFITEALVRSACAAAGHRWRRRVLGPAQTLQLFVLQVLGGNVACRAVAHLADAACTPQAYCAARMRLPTDVFGHVAAALTRAARRRTAGFGRWRGHRVLHVDGSGLSMPDTPALQKAYGRPQRGERPGFPVMHVLWLFDAATGLICDFIVSPWHTHDMAHASKLHAAMTPGDVLVGDRAFGSFVHLALLLQANLHGVFRLHQRQIVDFTPGRKHQRRRRKADRKGAPTSRWVASLGDRDQLVEYFKPTTRPTWMSADDFAQRPAAITVRELQYTIARPGFRTTRVTLVTTLLDPRRYTRDALAELYHARWRIEINLRHLKQTMKMDVLRSTTRDGVLKELWVYLIVYNRVRLVMLDAAARQGVEPDRISFIDTLDALRYHPADVPRLRLAVNPHRPGRHEPRVIKRRRDRYPMMTRPREQLRQTLGIVRLVA